MNEVDVINLKKLVNKYNSLIEKYQQNYLNIYNEIKNSNLYWVDPHALRFFVAIDIEKHKIDISYDELIKMGNIYEYIVRKYESIGNYISFNLENRDYLLSKLNTYINNINSIINSYGSLDYSFANWSVQSSINNQINSLRTMLRDAMGVKERIRTLLNDIKESENKIQNMINNVDISVLPYATTERFV